MAGRGAKGTRKKVESPVTAGDNNEALRSVEADTAQSVTEPSANVSEKPVDAVQELEEQMNPDCVGPTARFKSYCR